LDAPNSERNCTHNGSLECSSKIVNRPPVQILDGKNARIASRDPGKAPGMT
jgi:hypothetical protein